MPEGLDFNPILNNLLCRSRSSMVLTLGCMLIISVIFAGCSNGGSRSKDEKVLVRIGGSVVTVRDFHETFESGITAPSRLFSNPEALREEKFRILNRLTEELILLERARELGIEVSDEEVTLTADDFKKDYPDDTFEQALMENGVSYSSWEKALRRRLLMEKVLRKDLSENAFQVPLPFDENAAVGFQGGVPLDGEEPIDAAGAEDDTGEAEEDLEDTGPESNTEDTEQTPADTGPEGDIGTGYAGTRPENEAETEYADWIDRLKLQYPIEIDWKLWEKIEQEDTGGM